MADLRVFVDPERRLPVSARRLLVLVPSGRMDAYKLGRQVWELAITRSSQEVLYLSVVSAAGDEIEISRQLATLCSVTKDPRLLVDTQIQFGVSWPAAVRKVYRHGDQILCLEDRTVRLWLAKESSLAQWVARNLRVPVYPLGGAGWERK